jgi:formylglycine-generating enzyme required for sulfatase activity
MRKTTLFLLILGSALQSHSQITFTSENVTVRIASIQGYFPSPFTAISSGRVKATVLKGEASAKLFPGTVFFNPGNQFNGDSWSYKAKPKNVEPPSTLYPSFTHFYDTVSHWPLFVPSEKDFLVETAIRPIETLNWQKILQPFWFKKTEVTNGEYKMFVEAVRDSVLRSELSKTDARYKDPGFAIQLTLTELDSLAPALFLTPDNRIMRKQEWNAEKLIYRFTDATGKEQEVKVYPDTLVWIRDFAFSYGEPMTRRYFGHPAFKDYPVAGVNWYQARAYCHWLTRQLEKENNNALNGFALEAGLPFEYEREYVVNGMKEANGDYWWLTDLTAQGQNNIIQRRDFEALRHGNGARHYGYSRYKYGGHYTHLADVNKLLKGKQKITDINGNTIKPKDYPAALQLLLSTSIDEHGISGLSDNVSEWMNESFEQNWKPAFEQRRQLINSVQLGQLKELKATTLRDFYLQNIKVLQPKYIGASQYGGPITGVKKFDGFVFHDLPFSNVDSLEYLNIDEFRNSRQYMPQPRPATPGNLEKYKAIERTAAAEKNDYYNTEAAIAEAILQYRREIPIIRSLEDYYYRLNDTNGRLVRGGNWYDDRLELTVHASKNQFTNTGAINAKTFVDPAKASSMIGFRYVIRLVPLPKLPSP